MQIPAPRRRKLEGWQDGLHLLDGWRVQVFRGGMFQVSRPGKERVQEQEEGRLDGFCRLPGAGPQSGQWVGGTKRTCPRDGSPEVARPRDGRSTRIPYARSLPATIGSAAAFPESHSNTDDPALPAGWSPERPNPDGPAYPAGHANGPGREEVKPQAGGRGVGGGLGGGARGNRRLLL